MSYRKRRGQAVEYSRWAQVLCKWRRITSGERGSIIKEVTTKTYHNVSPERAQQLLDMARQRGARVTGSVESGGAQLDEFDVTIRAQYDANAQTLTVTIESKPFFLPAETVFSEIERNSGLRS